MVAVPSTAQATASVSVTTAVAQILADTNALRAADGLAPLTESAPMDTVAQNWSAQMGTTGSFVHNPSYSTQMPSGWTAAGENIASGYSYTTVVEAWHQSTAHYANIMGDYTDIGIGYYVDSSGQAYYTQDFGKYTTHPVVTASTSTSGSTAPTPVVSGNQIVDTRTSKNWIPHAVNWPSFEYACQQGWAESADGATSTAAAAMVSWGINAVRIPLNQDCWLGVDGAPAYGTTASYKSALSSWVSILNAAGLVVILDLHWTAPTGFSADGQRAMPDAQSVPFWSQVAAAYKNSPSVLFETFNEPYSRGSYQVSWSCWKSGGCTVPSSNDASNLGTATYTAHGMAEIVAGIRAAGASQPILLDGLNYANDLTGWLANRPSDSQLIASWHNYPGQGCSDTNCWNSQIVPVAATVPVIATEFGMTTTDPTFFNSFMSWADAHGIGYAPWAWWYTDSSDGAAANLYALISDLSSFTPRAPEGTAYHQHLTCQVPNSPAMSYVLAAYADVLHRTPPITDSGVQYWTSQIASGRSRADIAGSFNNSDEYRNLQITAAYRDVMRRAPDPGGAAYWLSQMQSGALQPDDVHRTFLIADEFYDFQGGGTDVGYVTALYEDVIGRSPDADGLGYWVGVLRWSGRAAVVNGLWFADETFNVRVNQAYLDLLGRNAWPSEQISWSAVARQIGLTGMRTWVMASDEYWNRAAVRFPGG